MTLAVARAFAPLRCSQWIVGPLEGALGGQIRGFGDGGTGYAQAQSDPETLQMCRGDVGRSVMYANGR